MTIAPRLFDEFEAKSELSHIEARCRRCVERAELVWVEVCEKVPRLRKAARARGRNAIFNEIVADMAREEFDGDAAVDLCEQYGTVRLHVDDRFDLGFKKVDSSGRASNYLTKRRSRYENQLTLHGEPLADAIRLHIGIQWNAAGTEVIDVVLAYPYQRKALWFYPLQSEVSQSANNLKMAAPVAAPKARFRSKIVKEDVAKKAKKAE